MVELTPQLGYAFLVINSLFLIFIESKKPGSPT